MDLTQAELAALTLKLFGSDVTVSASTFQRLLDMAARCVSEETVQKLARYRLESAKRDANKSDAISAWNEFTAACHAELRQAASKVTVEALTGEKP